MAFGRDTLFLELQSMPSFFLHHDAHITFSLGCHCSFFTEQMSSRTQCAKCLLAQRRQALSPKVCSTRSMLCRPLNIHQLTRPLTFRPLSTATKTVDSQNPPTSRDRIILDTVQPPPSATQKLAEGVRKAAPSLTETYVAYGVCETLVRECSRVADYQIPQANDKNAEIPSNSKGEDVGIGESWWYQSMRQCVCEAAS